MKSNDSVIDENQSWSFHAHLTWIEILLASVFIALLIYRIRTRKKNYLPETGCNVL